MTNYITPVKISTTSPKFPQRKVLSKSQLEKELKKRECKVQLDKLLKGGTMSQVYSGKFNGEPIVVKHTANMLPFDPTELFISKEGHNIDAKVLKLLDGTSIRVPKVIKHFPEITTTLMEDLKEEKFELLSSLILKTELPLNCSSQIGTSLAELAKISRKWKKFKTFETALGTIYEHGLELRLSYPNVQNQYLELENEYVRRLTYWTTPDACPKNTLVNKSGEVAFIDFGRSHFGDQRFMISNFIAHVLLYSIAGYVELDKAEEFVKSCVRSYKKVEPIDEEIFCMYLGMEILHRANGKWIEGINSSKEKAKLWKFGLEIFDKKINSVENLLRLVRS